ncbi:MAG: glycogen/starch synthase [Bacillota bacterium]|nr:glycogen/starch synthase [Bacillota bacterium]
MASGKERIKVLFASPEVMPFGGTGGLGEVAGSLPEAVNKLKGSQVECRVIMPLYGSVKDAFRRKMKFLGHTEIPVAWRSQYMGIFQLKKDGVVYYFVDNEYYFKRDRLYGFGDDCERFSYFSRAVLESALITGFVPDIIHANDWQTALATVFAKTIYAGKGLKTVFTVHNVEYQGRYGVNSLKDCIGLDPYDNHILRMGDDINLMKGAIECTDCFTTVSPTYARELTYPVSAFGLDGIIRDNEYKLTGILNGINVTDYDPSNDPSIEAAYSSEKLQGKKQCKRALQKDLGLSQSDAPMLTMITRLVAPKGIDIVMEMLDDLLYNHDMQFVMLGTGDQKYEDYFRELQYRHPDQVRSLIEFNTATAHRIYAAGDMLLMPSRSEACGLAQMIACRYGNVPIIRLTGGLADSIKEWNGSEGNGFTFYDYNGGELAYAVRRAMDLYSHKNKWRALVRHILNEDFSWARSAGEYHKLYTKLIKG